MGPPSAAPSASTGAASCGRWPPSLSEIKMSNLRRCFAGYLVCALVSTSIWPAMASERVFPFDRELMLDTAPMPGSKRVPIIEIAENGAASIDLWCARARGQASIGGDSITIVAGPIEPAQCAPERRRESTGGPGAGHELAPQRRCHRTSRCHHAAISLDDELRRRHLHFGRARHQEVQMYAVVLKDLADHRLVFGAELSELGRIVLQGIDDLR